MANNNSSNEAQQYSVRSMQEDLKQAKEGGDGAPRKVSVPSPSTQKNTPDASSDTQTKKSGAPASPKTSQGGPPKNLPGVGAPSAPPKKPGVPQTPQKPSVPKPPQPTPKKPGGPTPQTPPQRPATPKPKPSTPPSPKPKQPRPHTPPPLRQAQDRQPPRGTGGNNSKNPSSKPPGNRRRLLMLGAGALIIMLLIGFEVWWFFIRPDASQEPITRPSDSALPAPEETLPADPQQPAPPPARSPQVADALLQFDRTETVTIASPSAQAIQNALSQVIGMPRDGGRLVRLVFLVSENGTQRELTFEQFAQGLTMNIPDTVMAQLAGTANIFVFSPTVFDESACEEAGRSVDTCTGPRLGIAVQATESATLASSLTDWEPTMVRDLRPLIVTDISGQTTPFLDATYRGAQIRYRNMPLHTTTIDYALEDGRWIVTTSKSSMFAAIDALGVQKPN